MGVSCPRATFSTNPSNSVSRSSAVRTTAGTVSRPASRAARQRRSPATISYPPTPRGRTSSGWITPWRRTDSASPEAASGSKRRRGWRGFGWIASTGISSSSDGTGWPPIRTSRPRPRPRRWGEDSGALDKLHRHLPVGVGSGGATVVGNRGQPVARTLGETYRARDGGAEDEVTEVPPYLVLDLMGEPRPPVDHREQETADAEVRI